jgi:ankyrin repeat protein
MCFLVCSAALRSDGKIIKMLADAKCNVNATTSRDALTALHLAAQTGSFQVVRTLVQAGADLNVRNNIGAPPVSIAARSGAADVVGYLVEIGARLDIGAPAALRAPATTAAAA